MTPPRPDPRVEPMDKPVEKPTVPMNGFDVLKGLLREMRQDMLTEFRSTNANIQVVANDVSNLKSRVGSLEQWRVDEEGRTRRHSERVQALDERSSSTDLSHEKSIAIIQTEVQATKAKVDAVLLDVGMMAANVNKIVASPKAKMFASAAVAWLLGYLASKGLSIPALQ